MTKFTVNMYLVCEDERHFRSHTFFAPNEDRAEEKAKKHYLYAYYPFCVASFYRKEILSVEIIDIQKVEEEAPQKNNSPKDIDYIDDCEDMSMEEYLDTISEADFAKYFC